MTYREKIQKMMVDADNVYCDAGWLRDRATDEEKDYYNNIRAHLTKAITLLNQLDNKLPENRAQMNI